MCGGDSVSYTYQRKDLGLGLRQTETYADGRYVRTEINDTLLRQPECCWGRSPYNRDLTDADVDLTKLTVQESPKIAELIEARAEYMRRVAQRAEEDRIAEAEGRRGCTML